MSIESMRASADNCRMPDAPARAVLRLSSMLSSSNAAETVSQAQSTRYITGSATSRDTCTASIASSDAVSLASSDDFRPSAGELGRHRADDLAELTAISRAVTVDGFTWMVRALSLINSKWQISSIKRISNGYIAATRDANARSENSEENTSFSLGNSVLGLLQRHWFTLCYSLFLHRLVSRAWFLGE